MATGIRIRRTTEWRLRRYNGLIKRNTTMSIKYTDQSEMLDIVAGLVERGLCFEVYTKTNTILLTGGY